MSDTIFNKSIFKTFFSPSDPAVVAWADNVFEKIKSTEILPKWINRNKNNGDDFKSYWYPICLLFAYITNYSRQYSDIQGNEYLRGIWAKQRGLTLGNLTTSQLNILFSNYREEFRKRGTKAVFEKENAPTVPYNGEFLRLIDYVAGDDFMVAYLSPQDTGWCLGISSPMWKSTQTLQSVYKLFENSYNVEDLTLYNPIGTVSKGSISWWGETISTVYIEDAGQIGGECDVNSNQEYTFSGSLQTTTSNGVKLRIDLPAGVTIIDEQGATKNYYEKIVFADYLNWFGFQIKPYTTTPTLGNVYWGSQFDGANITFTITISDNSTGAQVGSTNIWNLKFRPSTLPFQQGQLGQKGFIVAWVVNHSSQTTQNIQNFADRYLVSYNNVLIINDLK